LNVGLSRNCSIVSGFALKSPLIIATVQICGRKGFFLCAPLCSSVVRLRVAVAVSGPMD
jgi:hypothetical protein